MSRDDLHTKRWSPPRVDLPVLPRESPSGKIQTRYFPPRREISETDNSCSCSCSNSCSILSHSWCMGEQLSYIHCWGVPQGSRSRPPASTGTLRYTPPVNVGNCTYSRRGTYNKIAPPGYRFRSFNKSFDREDATNKRWLFRAITKYWESNENTRRRGSLCCISCFPIYLIILMKMGRKSVQVWPRKCWYFEIKRKSESGPPPV